jgi:hypothetical protein
MSSQPEKKENAKNNEIEAQSETSREYSLKKRYEAPRMECAWRLHEVIQFGGSIPNETGGGFGPQA